MKIFFCAKGRVQGVGFRAFVRRHARAQDLAGWVRNEADGSVSGQACGDAESLALFRRLLKAGPSWGSVESLDWQVLDEGESLPLPFEIRP